MKIEYILSFVPYSIIWSNRKAIGNVKSILDLGSGDGTFMKCVMLNSNWDITAVDIHPKVVKSASKNRIYKKVIKGDINSVVKDLIQKKKKYDVVFFLHVL